ncbi:MAG: T9SS type A sorting domain-containing protein [Saprospiraceae bacterium]|nr:T9SS type A sorting domain-containing protein [Saprospiraceae bacterium]
MKAFYKLFAILFVFVAFGTNAQQLTTPMDVRVTAPSNIAGSFDYGYPTDWGPTTQLATIQGELVWAYNATDSLACTPITTNLTGKIALIRRGACGFSLKAYHAQQAGAIGTIILNHTYNADGGGIVNMLGGDSATVITTPAAFFTRDDGDLILAELDNGATVNAAFFIPVIDNAHAIFHYSTPQSQIVDLDGMDITVYNNSNHNETNVVATVVITDPNGAVTTLTENVANIAANTDSTISFTTSYTPAALGTYSAVFSVTADSATFNNETITQDFEITDYTWANDNGDNIGSIIPSGFDQTFRYDIGNTFFVGASNAVVTHMSFGLEEPDSLDGETFDIILYDMDANLDGTLDGTDYADFTTVAFGSYTVDAATMPANDTVVVELTPLLGNNIELNANGTYLITVQYDALNSLAGNTSPPNYIHASPTNYEFINTMVYTSQLFTGGWGGNWNAILRLHLDGFIISSATEDVAVLDNAKINVFPNPTTEFLTVDLELDNISEAVEVKITDVNGRVLATQNFSNVQNDKFTFDVSDYAAGNYFIRVQTEEGFKTKHFSVVK